MRVRSHSLFLLFVTALIASAAPGHAQDEPAAAPAAPAAQGSADPRAAEVAERALRALGGRDAWDATRFIRFEFAGRRTHHWDKRTGRHRLEGRTQDGKAFVVLHDLGTREGRAWLDDSRSRARRRGSSSSAPTAPGSTTPTGCSCPTSCATRE